MTEAEIYEAVKLMRRFSQWELGDPSWAHQFMRCITHPVEMTAYLDDEGADA